MSPLTSATPPEDDPVARLQAARSATAARVTSMLRERQGIVDSAAQVAPDDEHDPEGATLAFEREQIAALLSEARARLVALDAALARVEDGTYGHCLRCGRPIPAGRLLARPETDTCVTCAALR